MEADREREKECKSERVVRKREGRLRGREMKGEEREGRGHD